MNNKKRMFELLSKLDESFKINLNENIDEGWKDWAAGAMMAAASLGGMHGNAKTQTIEPTQLNISKQHNKITNAVEQIRTPEDLIELGYNVEMYSTTEFENLFNNEARIHFFNLMKNDKNWVKAFDDLRNLFIEKRRVGSEYQLYLQNDNAKKIAEKYNLENNKIYDGDLANKFLTKLNEEGLNYFSDFLFMVTKKGENFNKYVQYFHAIDYINWSVRR